ncbi:hypothetical protein B0H17DRAFT_1200014 [Mycena rosella]|uniref:Uncharacterized protein n=1 Tax=Mycena rosella TaxID=1033263 RepID=A0AAD7DJH4_MYCRO|nr:hypothetical protein B0H17DRAFT_1200014 [Mycena rosella]
MAWTQLCIQLTSALNPLLSTLRDCLPSLRRSLIHWDNADSQAGVASIDCLQNAPSLVGAAIRNQYCSVPVLLPVQQLTRYHLDGPWKMHRDILKLAHNLVDAHISLALDDGPWLEQADSIGLEQLRRLFVSHSEILTYLKAPALKELSQSSSAQTSIPCIS